MHIHRAIRLGCHSSSLGDVPPLPRQAYHGVDTHNKSYKVNDFIQHANANAKTSRAVHAQLLWSKIKEGKLSPSAEEAVKRDYAEEFKQLAKKSK